MKNIIAVAGNARSGKDTVGHFIQEILQQKGKKAKVISFADKLKHEINDFCISNLGISAFTYDDEKKKIIRPFLVCWGTEIRRAINENYWIECLEQDMDNETLYIITDLRFINEHFWIKENKGISIYLERESIAPANHYERDNNAILKTVVDHVWEMPTTRDLNVLKEYIEKKCLHSLQNII